MLEEDAALRDPEPAAFDEPLEEEAERGAGEKRRKPTSRAPPLDLRREKLPGGYGQAARRSLAEKARSRGGDGDDAVVTIRRERARELRDAGGAAPAAAFLSNARALFFAAGDAMTPPAGIGEPEPDALADFLATKVKPVINLDVWSSFHFLRFLLRTFEPSMAAQALLRCC